MSLVLLPLVVPALLLAPWLLPLALGERWTESVAVFQILFPIGVAHAVLNLVGESLGGSGNVKLHAQLLAVWVVVIVPALLVLVPAYGIRGAAVAHVLVLVPVAAGYLLLGARRLGLPALGLVRGLAGVAPPLLAQLAVTLAGFSLLAEAGSPDALARVAGVLMGVGAAIGVLLLRPSGPLLEARSLLAAARQRS
jgi:O-antigen/teichoic acid export membrane protein